MMSSRHIQSTHTMSIVKLLLLDLHLLLHHHVLVLRGRHLRQLAVERLAGLDLHGGDIMAHEPAPLGQHVDHGPRDLAVASHDLLPLGGQGLVAALLAEEVEEHVGDDEPAHVRVLVGVIEEVLDIVQVGHAGRVVFLDVVVGKVGVDGVDGRVLAARDAELVGKDVQADARFQLAHVAPTEGRK